MAIKQDALIARLRDHGDVVLAIYTSRVGYRLCERLEDGAGVPGEHVNYGTARKLIENGKLRKCELPRTYLTSACEAYEWVK